jgi:predicted nucleotidyltransferase
MIASHFSKDIQEFLRLLEKHDVKYVIVGGEAVIYYGYARLTGDVDFLYGTSGENIGKLFRTLSEFWDGSIPGLEKMEELAEPGVIIQFGVPPNRIDLLNRIDGVTFEEVWLNRTTCHLQADDQKVCVFFIGLDELIKNKEAMGRHKDMEDLKYLRSVKQQGI